MKTITNLTGIAIESPNPDLHCGFALSDEPVPGFIRQLRMGITGLLLTAGETQLLIPTAAIWSIAEANDPSFKPSAKPSRRPSQ